MSQSDQPLPRIAAAASLTLIMAGVSALIAFGNFFYYYSLTGQRQFTSAPYFVIYYGVPLTAAVLLFAALRLSPSHRVNVVLVLLASGVSVLALEWFIEWRVSSLYTSMKPVMSLVAAAPDRRTAQEQAAALSRQWGVDIDTRTTDEVLASLRTSLVDPIPIMTPSNHLFRGQPDGSITSAIRIAGVEVMPLAAVSNRVTLLCNDGGQWIHYTSDKRGFNNPDEVWDRDRLDIAAVGDSFTQGYCVSSDDGFVARIRQRYPATLNLGIAGDGPLLMLATLSEFLPRLKPKVVLWFYFEGNDLPELENERKSKVLSHYLTDDFAQPALTQQHEIDDAIIAEMPRLRTLAATNRTNALNNRSLAGLIAFMKLSALRERLSLVGGVSGGELTAFDDANMAVLRSVLFHAQARVAGWGGQLVFVYLPDWPRYAGYRPPAAMKRDDVLAVVRDLGIPAVDVHTAFEAHGDPLALFPFRRPAHYNAIGHQVVAADVLETLSRSAQLQ